MELRGGKDGGGLRRVNGDAEMPLVPPSADIETSEAQAQAVRLERDLYEPFREWLEQELDEDAFVFAEAVVTALARRQGKWTQPDVCQLTVTNFENLPAASVELSTYELKRQSDAGKLEGVYEAAAHGRWANRANLVLEVADRDSKIAPEILKDARRFGLGVFRLWFTEAGRLSVQRLVAPGRQSPDDSDLDDMIRVVLNELNPKHRAQYRQAVK